MMFSLCESDGQNATASGGRNRECDCRKKHRESRTDVSESTMFLTGGFAQMLLHPLCVCSCDKVICGYFITSQPIYFLSASGTVTEPSSFW